MRKVEIKAALPLELVLTLTRALSHKIRTPLSVISNDLNFFKTLIDPKECDRGLAKCRAIAQFFEPCERLQNQRGLSEDFSVADIVEESVGYRAAQYGEDFTLRGNKLHFSQALKWMNELFPFDNIRFIKASRTINFSPRSAGQIDADLDPGFTSLTEIYFSNASDDSILPVLIDSVMFTFGGEFKLTTAGEVSLSFREQ